MQQEAPAVWQGCTAQWFQQGFQHGPSLQGGSRDIQEDSDLSTIEVYLALRPCSADDLLFLGVPV